MRYAPCAMRFLLVFFLNHGNHLINVICGSDNGGFALAISIISINSYIGILLLVMSQLSYNLQIYKFIDK